MPRQGLLTKLAWIFAICHTGYSCGRPDIHIAEMEFTHTGVLEKGCARERVYFKKPTAVAEWRRGKRNRVTHIWQTEGPRNGSYFKSGPTRVCFRGEYCGSQERCDTVHVNIQRCPTHSRTISNGNRNCISPCGGPYVKGSRCMYTCYAGYKLPDWVPHESVCQGRTWSVNPEPPCEPSQCQPPSNVNNGHWDCGSSYSVGRVCHVRCDYGYGVRGNPFIMCQTDGTWTSNGSPCIDARAPVFPHGCPADITTNSEPMGRPALVTIQDPQTTDVSSVTLTYKISGVASRPQSSVTGPGGTTRHQYLLDVGTYTVTVFAEDEVGNTNKCNFSVTVTAVTCPSPTEEFNNTHMVFRPSPSGPVMYGTSINVSCSHGFPQQGSRVMTCQLNNVTNTARWEWPGDREAMRPNCVVVPCPDLDPPYNGALTCFTSTAGTDCLMSCNENYDIPANLKQLSLGRFTCPNSRPQWFPPSVPDCLVRVRPGQARVQAEIFYFTGSCNQSTDDLRQKFIQRITNDTFSRDACVGVPTCVPENVQVICSSRNSTGSRQRRDVDEYFVQISFEMAIPLQVNQTSLQAIQAVQASLVNTLRQDVSAGGPLAFEGLTTDEDSVSGSLGCDSPAGRTCSTGSDSFSCVGCSRGQFMDDSDQCQQCPKGSYNPEGGATDCVPCPPGMSTDAVGSHNITQCKVPAAGGWGDWSFWSQCSLSCGGGQQHRHRQCNNPLPEPGGRDCVGDVNETRDCGEPFCAVDGGWGQWSLWSNCSATCNGGELTRTRVCDSPAPAHGGLQCTGSGRESQFCNSDPCPVEGGWNEWSDWDQCSSSCEGGTQSRERLCDNPPPALGGANCTGNGTETQDCNLHTCPVCPVCPHPANALAPNVTVDGEAQNCTITCEPGYLWAMGFDPQFYCGPLTDFEWSTVPDFLLPPGVYLCARISSNEGGSLVMTVPLNQTCTGDNPEVEENVTRQIEAKVATLPCRNHSKHQCNTRTAVACVTFHPLDQSMNDNETSITTTTTRTTTTTTSTVAPGSIKLLHVHFSMDGVLGESQELTPGTAAYDDYVELMTAAEESARVAVEEPERLFTVMIEDDIAAPDVVNMDIDGQYTCPDGTREIDGFCGNLDT